MIKAIAFDLGRVLVDFDYQIALSKLSPFLKAPKKDLVEIVEKESFAWDFERGAISPQDFYRRFCQLAGLKGVSFSDFVKIWNDIFTLKEDMFKLAQSLARGYFLILISNLNVLHLGFLQAKYPFLWQIFDRLVISSLVGFIKPQPEIYELMSKGFKKEELAYIDDRQDLVAQSRKLGYNTIRFENRNQCWHNLQELGVKKAPA